MILVPAICFLCLSLDWFYYSPTGDLTNSIQRQHTNKEGGFDERFFWNQHMLQDVLEFKVMYTQRYYYYYLFVYLFPFTGWTALSVKT